MAHSIAYPRILGLIGLWPRAGVLESGQKQETDRGTAQGAGISPLLANIASATSSISGPTNGDVAMHTVAL